MNSAGIIGHRRPLRHLAYLLRADMIPHALLFTGVTGIGKRLVARRFVTALFCSGTGERPCGDCVPCRQAAAGTFPDIVELGPDEKGSLPIGDADGEEPGTVRWLIARLSRRSLSGRQGVIIDGAEAIGVSGQNALLKTIEEPQDGSVIVIVTANKNLILPTILSRCSEISFAPLADEELAAILAAEGLPSIATQLSGGSVEIARVLGGGSWNAVIDIAAAVAEYLATGAPLDLDPAPVVKTLGPGNFITVMTALYRLLLGIELAGGTPPPELIRAAVPDAEKLAKLVKIFLALRTGLQNNLNIRSALKGLLYAIDRPGQAGLPRLDLAYTEGQHPWKYRR